MNAMNRNTNRRTVLKGVGVTLTLPLFESLLPRAHAASAVDPAPPEVPLIEVQPNTLAAAQAGLGAGEVLEIVQARSAPEIQDEMSTGKALPVALDEMVFAFVVGGISFGVSGSSPN